MRRKSSRTRKITPPPHCPNPTFSKTDARPSLYTVTIRGDTPSRAVIFGKTMKKSQPFTQTSRKTRVYATTPNKKTALRLQQKLEQKGERVVITTS